VTNLNNLNNAMANDVFMSFFLPYTYALCVYYKEEKHIDILTLTQQEQIRMILDFTNRAPSYLNKAIWRKANTAIDFDAIFTKEPHEDEAVCSNLAEWRKFFQLKIICGFKYTLNAFNAPEEFARKRSKKTCVEMFKSLYEVTKMKEAMPPIEDLPVTMMIKVQKKDKMNSMVDESLNEWLIANKDITF
jgi:hypothetical protein